MPRCRFAVCASLAREVSLAVPKDMAAAVTVSPLPCAMRFVAERAAAIAALRAEAGASDEVEVIEPAHMPGAELAYGCTHCAGLLLPPTRVDQLLADRVLVTSGWLQQWQEHGSPVPPVTPALAARRAVAMLDTGIDAEAPRRLDAYAAALGLPSELVAVGLDDLRLHVQQRLLQWSLRRMAAAERETSRRAAQYELTLDVLGTLAVLADETRVIAGVADLFTQLFAPGYVRFRAVPHLPVLPGAEPPAGAPRWTAPAPWEETERGFRLKIEHDNVLLGVFEIGDLAVPAARQQYINLAVALARATGMAIANARALHGIITICAHCKKILDESGNWRALETYLMQHSDARFSHGICPVCAQQFFAGAGKPVAPA